MSDPQLVEPPPVGPQLSAVDFVPLWSFGLGLLTTLAGAVWLMARRVPGGGMILMAFVVLAALGLTFGLCGVLLALRDARHMKSAVAGTLLNLVLPAIMFAGGPEEMFGA